MNNKISVVIITYNEKKIISYCLSALKWANEIILVDSFSKDKTVEIAKKYGGKVVLRKFDGYVKQKNFGIAKAKNKWVLSLDADEIVTEQLRDEILFVIKNDGQNNGFLIPRKNYYYGKFLRFGGVYPDKQARLFKKTSGRFEKAQVHECVKIKGQRGELREALLHYTRDTVQEHIEYINRYTELEVKALAGKAYRPTGYSIILKPILYFLKHYIFKAGFLDGVRGLIYHSISAIYVFLKEVKAAEVLGLNGIKLKTTLFKRSKTL